MGLLSFASLQLFFRFLNFELKLFSANFALPDNDVEADETPLFKEIIFTELDREEAAKLVEEYNKVKLQL